MTTKFVDEISVNDWEIETPSGWVPINKVFATVPYTVWRIECSNGMTLDCADKHIVIHEGTLFYAKDLLPGDLIETADGETEVVKIYALDSPPQTMYDVEVGSDDHLYYSNGIVSHNTTTVSSYLTHEAIFNENKQIAILANKGDTSIEILDRIKKSFEELPWFIKPGVVTWNKRSIEFGNGSKIFASSTSSSSIRGRSINILYIDEMGFVDNDVEFYTSTYPVITAGTSTKVIVTSTPNGMNLFYKLWTDSVNGRNEYANRKYTWECHPDRDEKWKETTIKNTSVKQFSREYDCVFEGSSNTLIEGWKLQQLTYVNPIATDEHFKIYEQPDPDGTYIATVDVSEGVSQDYSVVHVFNVSKTPYTQVAIYRDNTVAPMLFSDTVFKIIKAYNEAYCIVEYNAIGKIVADSLYYEYEYDNMLSTVVKDADSVVSTAGRSVGLRQTKKTKAIGSSILKSLIESDTLLVRDYDTIMELSTFIKKGSSWQAESKKTDDIVMTMVMFAWFTGQTFFEDLMSDDIKSIIKKNYAAMEDSQNSIFGFFDDGSDEEVQMF